MFHLMNCPHNLRGIIERNRLVHPSEAKASQNLPMFFRSTYHTANKSYLDLLGHTVTSSWFRLPTNKINP